MTSDPKKHGVAFWTTVVMALLLLAYPVSFGPVCWMADREIVARTFVCSLYNPLVALIVTCPRPIQRTMFNYGKGGSPVDTETPVWGKASSTSTIIFHEAWVQRDGKP